jgi:hypothetical protein
MAAPPSKSGVMNLEILLVVALMAGFFLPSELLQLRPSWLRRVTDGGGQPGLVGGEQLEAVPDRSSAAVEMSMQEGLFGRAVIQRRLVALAEELERLDRDPDVFAKAFHTTVVRSAYQALLIDAAAFVEESCPYIEESLHLELVGPSTALWEELEL